MSVERTWRKCSSNRFEITSRSKINGERWLGRSERSKIEVRRKTASDQKTARRRSRASNQQRWQIRPCQRKFIQPKISIHFNSKLSVSGQPYPVYQPVWFKKEEDPITGALAHVYTGKYWEAKAKQDWSMCPNIFWFCLFLISALGLPIDEKVRFSRCAFDLTGNAGHSVKINLPSRKKLRLGALFTAA